LCPSRLHLPYATRTSHASMWPPHNRHANARPSSPVRGPCRRSRNSCRCLAPLHPSSATSDARTECVTVTTRLHEPWQSCSNARVPAPNYCTTSSATPPPKHHLNNIPIEQPRNRPLSPPADQFAALALCPMGNAERPPLRSDRPDQHCASRDREGRSLVGGAGGGRPKMASPALTSKLGAELEWLQRTLHRLRATISDAEQIQTQGKSFAVWLQDMKDIACDAEDLIDEFEYEDLRRQIEGNRGRGRSTGSSSGKVCRSMMCKVHDIKRRLGDIGKYKNRLGIGDVDGRADQELMRGSMQQTGSLPTESEIFGREKEKEEILRFLLAPDDDSVVSTIAITGMGGLGKTTLAQLVYNDRRVVEHFKPRMWIWTASDYDVMELTREILGSIDLDIKLAQNLRNLDVYQRAIVDKLEGKQFLLVLDNLWDRNQKKWQSLVAPLMYGTKKGRQPMAGSTAQPVPQSGHVEVAGFELRRY
ncbi:hypothetical protein Taro_043296, partial [Colocasia esculenta]|nr:hypothetical protein [Colocasia esculenta]